MDAAAAVEALSAHPEFEPNGPSTAPDWRVQLSGRRTADVEVTSRPDGDMSSFFAALQKKDGTPKVWRDDQLSWDWNIMVVDHHPGYNKGRRRLKKLIADLAAVLAEVEATSGDPEQMQAHAQAALGGALLLTRTDDTLSGRDFPGLQIEDGAHSQRLRVIAPPTRDGYQSGSIEMIPLGGAHGVSLGRGDLVDVLRDCIDTKTEKRQLDNAPGMKWLAVVLDGVAGIQLKHHYGGGESQKPPPKLDGISFDYFDEVWAIRPTQDDMWRSGRAQAGPSYEPIFVVLRLSDRGETQRHYVVPRLGVGSSAGVVDHL